MIHLWDLDAPAAHDRQSLPRRRLIQSRQPRPLVLVCPGGGYGHLAPHEGMPVAEAFNRHGFHAAVLDYSLAPDAQHPQMLNDVQRAIRLIRKLASDWGVTDKIAVLGFSAGGHLASSAATLFDQYTSERDDLAGAYSARPDAAVLCYAVLELLDPAFAHGGSRKNLLGAAADDDALAEAMSTCRRVTPQTPPCFLWHTAEDPGVPVDNSLRFTAACRRHNVPVELHVYESGRHGVGLAPDLPARGWVDLAAAFLHRHLDA